MIDISSTADSIDKVISYINAANYPNKEVTILITNELERAKPMFRNNNIDKDLLDDIVCGLEQILEEYDNMYPVDISIYEKHYSHVRGVIPVFKQHL